MTGDSMLLGLLVAVFGGILAEALGEGILVLLGLGLLWPLRRWWPDWEPPEFLVYLAGGLALVLLMFLIGGIGAALGLWPSSHQVAA